VKAIRSSRSVHLGLSTIRLLRSNLTYLRTTLGRVLTAEPCHTSVYGSSSPINLSHYHKQIFSSLRKLSDITVTREGSGLRITSTRAVNYSMGFHVANRLVYSDRCCDKMDMLQFSALVDSSVVSCYSHVGQMPGHRSFYHS
jgi:hypothetical protein